MRLHLPKGLLAALLAACFALPAGAAITTTPLTSLEVDGVELPTGTYNQVTTDDKDTMTALPTAAVTFLKATGNKNSNNEWLSRFKVTSAEQVSSAGTLVVAEATLDGATSKTSAGQLYFSRWVGGDPAYDDSPLTISNDIIIGRSESTCALRFSDSNQASRPITLTGNITLAQDASIGIDNTTVYAYMTGNIKGANKTLTICKPDGPPDGGTLTLGDGTTGKTLTLGGLTMTSKTSVVMNYKEATIGTLKLESTADTPFSITGGRTEVTGAITIKNGKQITVASGATLTHDGFSYDGSTIATPTAGTALSLFGNATVTGGTLTQNENSSGVSYKIIGATLTNVKLVNTEETHEAWLTSESDTLTGMEIAGTLRVGQDDRTLNADTQELEGTFNKTSVTVSGAAKVTGTVKVDTESTLELAGQDATSTIATLTGNGTLKTSAGTTTVSNASGFSGTLEATGGQMDVDLTAQGATKKLVEVTAAGGSINVMNAASLTVVDMVISNDSTVGVYSGAEATTEGNLNITGAPGDENGNGAYMASLTIGSGARLNANLLVYRATLDFSGNTLAIGNTLTLIAGSASELLNIPTLSAGQSLTLFTGVDSFSTDWFGGSEEAVTVDDASTIFSNLTSGTYSLKYTGAAAGGDVLLIANNPTPEPTTATLSLLALMGLAARRRRKA